MKLIANGSDSAQAERAHADELVHSWRSRTNLVEIVGDAGRGYLHREEAALKKLKLR